MIRKIVVDHREQAAELIQGLRDHDFEVELATLDIGDYRLPGGTLVERKTTRDFCVSILDGRLFRQAYAMSNYADSAIFLVEGTSFLDLDIDISIEAVKGAMVTVAQTFRLPILRSRDQADSLWYLNQLANQRERVGERKGSLSAYRPRRLDTQKKYVLRSLPGIGPKTAQTLIDHFGSVRRVLNATEAELLEVEGVGPKLIEQMTRVLREDPTPYEV